ncbi:MAG: T9SS type A sorting domain-containing protein [Saprospiraceae bacterium]|nr:T9SS type A sorting domain-containing protein [Saprospiraceae bacterium]
MYKQLLYPTFFLFFLIFQTGFSQSFERLDIPFVVEGKTLAFPLAGGLNAPQLSAADFNNDGIQDLYVFDREGNRQLTFLNAGTPGTSSYVFAPEYAANFPRLENWVLLRDFNNDGAMDIFAYPDQPVGGIMVYRGYYENNQLKFQRFNFNTSFNIIFFPLPNGSSTQIYVSTIDYPAIDDLDCDGDLDIATFNIGGGYVEFFANRSVEMGFGRDSLIFRFVDNCWGGIYENSFSPAVEFGNAPGDCAGNLTSGEDPINFRHSGSSLLTFDGDGDGDKELVLGDITFNSINYLTNQGSCQEAWFHQQDTMFPSYNLSVDIPVFPATFYLDVNNDGKNDLLAAPNSRQSSDSYDALWFYQNVNTAQQPAFSFQKKNFLIEDMVDLGSGAYPVFVDYNADGLKDLVIGNYSYYVPLGEKDARLFLFKNTGTATHPSFLLVDEDWLGMSQFSSSATFAFAPAFGDMDNDNDLDLIVGEQNGALFFMENIAGPGNPLAFGPVQYNNFGIDVGQASTVQIVDLDEDGISDLVIGEKNCNLNFAKGLGNNTFETIFSGLGNVNSCPPGFLDGYAHPVFLKINDAWKLFVGTTNGNIKTYGNIEGNLFGAFQLLEPAYGGIKEGNQVHLDFDDIDADGWLDVVVGNFSGGISIFRTDIEAVVVDTEAPVLKTGGLKVFPNPGSGVVSIQLTENDPEEKQFFLFDAAGRLVAFSSQNENLWPVHTENLSSGIYFVQVISRQRVFSSKLTIE